MKKNATQLIEGFGHGFAADKLSTQEPSKNATTLVTVAAKHARVVAVNILHR